MTPPRSGGLRSRLTARRRHFLLRPRQSILVKESGGSVLACEKLSPTVAQSTGVVVRDARSI